MPYRVNCPTCKTAYNVADDSLGKTLQCKKCQKPFTVGKAKTPAPVAVKPPLPSPPKAAAGRTTTDLPSRPATKAAPQRDAAQPARRKQSPILIIGVLAAVLFVLGGVVAGAVVAGIYFFKPRQETPIAQNTIVNNEAKEPSAPPANKGDLPEDTKTPPPPATTETVKPGTTTDKSDPTTDKPPSSSPPNAKPPQPPDPPVSDRAQLPRTAEVGKPFTYQLSRSGEKVRTYTLHSGPKGLKISKEGLLQWTPEPGQVGSHKLLVGVVTAKLSGADIYTVVVRAAGEPETSKPLPPDLDLVPGDGAIFLSLQVAETWKNPALAPVRKLAETDKNIANTLLGLKMMGLDPNNVERAVAVFWGKQKTPYSVGLVTMVKPYNRQLILGLIGDGQREEKIGAKSVISSPKSPFALHFIDERAFVYGRTAEVKKLIERPAGPTRKAAWNEILSSAPQHTFLIGVQHDAFLEDPKKDTPPMLKALNPLLDAHTAVASLDAGKDLRLTARLMFTNDAEVKQAESAAHTGLELAAAVLGQFAEQFKKQLPGAPPSLAKLAPVMRDAEGAVKKATIQSKDRTLECQVKLQSADWPEALAAGAMMFFAPANKSPSPQGEKPAPDKEQAPKSPAEAEAAIKKLGGRVERDEKQSGSPIVEVTFLSKKLSDDDLAIFRSLSSVKRLLLLEGGITDQGVKHLAGLVNLEELNLVGNRLSDTGLEHLKGLKKLQILEVSGNDITDAGLIPLKDLTALKSLSVLGSVKITDKGMAHLAVFKNLEKLDVSGTVLTGTGLVHLKELDKLRDLKLSNNRITNGELAHLKNFTNLTKLDLSGNLRITDAGLSTLKELTKLKEVRLISTGVTEKGVAELKKALPEAEIKR